MNKFRTAAVTAAAVVGVAAGGYGISAATTGQTDPAPASTEADDIQDPQLDGSVQVVEVDGESEADETSRLADQATVSEADAAAAATKAHPGDISASQLENENGSLVWEFTVTQADGSTLEVKVDAGNGSVLAADAVDETEADEAAESEETEAGDEDSDEDSDGVDYEFEGEETGNNGDGVADADDANEVEDN
jgi:hypothetical protein